MIVNNKSRKNKKYSIQTSGIELANMTSASTPVPYHAE
jgi:hypothetical protein